ncbi:metallopeptidase MepB [Metarhizium anisopliae]
MASNEEIQSLPRFAATPDSIAEDAERLVQRSRRFHDDLVQTVTPSAATFANVILPLINMENEFALQSNILCFYRHVSEDAEIRAASSKVQTLFNAFLTELLMREDIFTLVRTVHNQSKDLDQESASLLTFAYNRHIQTGVGLLGEGQKQRFQAIQARLSQIKTAFRENLVSDKTTISFTLAELEGVPDRILAKLEKKGAPQDQYEVILSNPSHMEILSYATRSETRKRMFIASQNRCSDNGPLLKEAVILRHESACLLGFPNHAARQLQGTMAETPNTVNDFLEDLRIKITPTGLDSLKVFKDSKRDHLSNQGEADQHNDRFFLWDYQFYHRLILEQEISLDRQKLREYFPVQTTIANMMSIFAHLFGLEFTELQTGEKTPHMFWHEDVQVFRVHESRERGREFLGHLYIDLFHRPGKYAQASCFNLQPGFTRQDGSRSFPAVAFLCDIPKPTSTKPSLLWHFEVVLMFHELGHSMHDIVCKTKYSRFHGPDGVPVDFGELPSQMLEQWCWMPSQLKALSCHYSYVDSGMLELWKMENEAAGVTQPDIHMPDEMIKSLLQARRLTFGPLFYLDQLQRSMFDMAIHQPSNMKEAESLDPAAVWNRLHREIRLIDGPEALGQGYTWGHGYATFSHLMQDDYSAGYYAYLFSQVFAADLFFTGFKDNLTNSEQGQRYRQVILEKGGCQDHMQALGEFLGRAPSAKPFESLLGI